jgi:hypothetical protein
MNSMTKRAGLAMAVALAAACAQDARTTERSAPAAEAGASPPASAPAALRSPGTESPDSAKHLPAVVVHKSPSCGCCALWVEHIQAAGFQVEVRNVANMGPIKEQAGVPVGKGSCHTAQVGGYFIEGHVPADDVKRLLAERPDALGLVVPGMPAGSPGMEMPDGRTQPYAVELVHRDGTTTEFVRHGDH